MREYQTSTVLRNLWGKLLNSDGKLLGFIKTPILNPSVKKILQQPNIAVIGDEELEKGTMMLSGEKYNFVKISRIGEYNSGGYIPVDYLKSSGFSGADGDVVEQYKVLKDFIGIRLITPMGKPIQRIFKVGEILNIHETSIPVSAGGGAIGTNLMKVKAIADSNLYYKIPAPEFIEKIAFEKTEDGNLKLANESPSFFLGMSKKTTIKAGVVVGVIALGVIAFVVYKKMKKGK